MRLTELKLYSHVPSKPETTRRSESYVFSDRATQLSRQTKTMTWFDAGHSADAGRHMEVCDCDDSDVPSKQRFVFDACDLTLHVQLRAMFSTGVNTVIPFDTAGPLSML
jgi:hypothetical protein